MTVQEYIEKNKQSISLETDDKEIFIHLDRAGIVLIEQGDEFPYELKHIKTMEQFSQLCELLTGKPFDYE